uniref:UDP-N-acetylmuramoylalanine--D-glutamate ligase n=1 Tax=uncultured Flavobacteriia bacterium TaxID=212695 RepID=H6RFW0_9BACT|nr:UDP-N-acetylmuramoylalanine--D-glutamate ligase [uncultured bacterium]CCF99921.1 UDP-N-acetylmuramoylalanine--D-glutamate ligase (UDP-N-acetylmuramoyl-L-alanyl-D-glutamate synthetase) (D-glutamic acid-adding enzyme) [uncultured Flavobacteriia bacterium]
MEKVWILGGGESGVGAALLAQKKGYEVFLSEGGSLKKKYRDVLIHHEIRFEEQAHSESWSESTVVVKSPGIPNETKIVQDIRTAGIEVISEVELAYRNCKSKFIGITGSNGKTSTTGLLFHLLEKAKLDVAVAGNIGKSICWLLTEREPEYLVVELSSFQLDDVVDFKPIIAILLNISPDHLDRYDYKLENYAEAKFRITKNQSPEDFFIYWNEDELLNAFVDSGRVKARTLSYGSKETADSAAWIEIEEESETELLNLNNKLRMSIQKLALQGRHNIYNSMAAGVAGRILDLRKEVIRDSLMDFQNIEHRLEHVVSVCGVKYINDSKATNVNSCWWALESMDRPSVWIAGGVDKGNDYSSLVELVDEKVKGIVLIGSENEKFKASFAELKIPIIEVMSMELAVREAYNMADKGDAVLLSPACASFDLFDNYEDRGHQFKYWVRHL